MSLKIQTEDRYIYAKDQLIMYLYDCWNRKENPVIQMEPEGPCAQSLGLYDLLDEFCKRTNFDQTSITIETANMLENHDRYNIVKKYDYWYEISPIKQWAKNLQLDTGTNPIKHFGNFIGRARWPRLWIGAWLNLYHRDKTLQTFHSALRCNYRTHSDQMTYDWLGIEDLILHDCDMIPEVINFLDRCPIVIEDDLEIVKRTPITIQQDGHYPLQHPANLNIVHYYKHIFVDIIIEPNMAGDCFLSTEKLWRCIVAKRPFIIVSCRDHLYNLQKLGFRTFHDWWREEYDGQNNQTRIRMIQEQISEISTLPLSDLGRILTEMKSILDHNYDVFISLGREKFANVFGAV